MTHAPLPPLRTPAPSSRLAYRPAEAATLLGVSRATVDRWIADGKLPASRVGRTVLVRASDVEELLASNHIGGAA